MDIKTFAIAAILIAIFVNCEVEARPQRNAVREWFNSYQEESECQTSEEVKNLCQRCAKVTKHHLAYTMCCEMKENTRTWCSKFLNFGLTNPDNHV